MKKILPLFLAGCMHHSVASVGRESPEGLLLRATDNLTYDANNGVRGYSRRDNLFMLDGRFGLGYYTENGLKVDFDYTSEIVNYLVSKDYLRFIVNSEDCVEEYYLDFENKRKNWVNLEGECELFGSLGERIQDNNGLTFYSLSRDEREMVDKRRNDLVIQEYLVVTGN